MRCGLCETRSRVIESRPTEDGATVRRRRECPGCGHRFTTFERVVAVGGAVRKRDERLEPFDPAKVRAGLERAAHKRPEAERAVERITSAIEAEASGGELTSRRIGELCLEGLRGADQVAYLRFASVHKQLADTEAIRAELAELGREVIASATSGGLGNAANAENFDPDPDPDGIADSQHFDTDETRREIHA